MTESTQKRIDWEAGSASDRPGAAVPPAAAAAGLVYVSDAVPGIRRVRRDAGFVYALPDGRPVTSDAELRRIASLAIPPAYEDVWICADPRGHMQATGRDARGRKQYRYHPQWRAFRDGEKFERMPAFGEALPRLRRRLRLDLALPGLPREKVLAVVVSLLDATRMRIGNDGICARQRQLWADDAAQPARALRPRTASSCSGFAARAAPAHEVAVDDRRLARLVRRLPSAAGAAPVPVHRRRRPAADRSIPAT